MVQQIAQAACDDGLVNQHVKRLSHIGDDGTHPQNASRDLTKMVHTSALGGSVSSFATWTRLNNATNTVFQIIQHMILPHLLFAQVYHSNKCAFIDRILGGSVERVQEFWRAMRGNPTFEQHPLKSRDDFSTRAIPILLHGDGAPVTGVGKIWGRSAVIMSWCSMLGKGKTLLTNYLIYFYYKQFASKDDGRNTMTRMFEKLLWSFRALSSGKHPTHDEYGNPYTAGDKEYAKRGTDLADGWYGVLFGSRGDLEYHADVGLERWDSATRPCFWCDANCANTGRDARPWTDFTEMAAWRGTLHTSMVAWRNARPNRHILHNFEVRFIF